MPYNITYLLGAGASANCLPVINELPSKLSRLKSELEIRVDPSNIQKYILTDPQMHIPARSLINDIKSLLIELQAHNTIDTLAKKYYLTGKHDKLEQLKKVLIVYFAYEQAFKYGEIRKGVFKELPDKRYDSSCLCRCSLVYEDGL